MQEIKTKIKLERSTLNLGLIFAGAILFITLIGTPAAFDKKEVITNTINLNHFMLIGLALGAGYGAAGRTSKRIEGLGALAFNGAVAAGIASTSLALFTIFARRIDLRGVFTNVSPELLDILAFKQSEAAGLLIMVVGGVLLGALGALLIRVPRRTQSIVLVTVLMTLLVGLLQDQINGLLHLSDALIATFWIGAGYLAAGDYGDRLASHITGALSDTQAASPLRAALLRSLIAGLLAGALVLGLLLLIDPSAENTIFIEGLFGKANGALLMLIASAIGALLGALLSMAPVSVHNMGMSFITLLLILGIMQAGGQVSLGVAILIAALLTALQLFGKTNGAAAQKRYGRLGKAQKRSVRTTITVVGVILLLAIPTIIGYNQYISNILGNVGLYVLMGLGLNIVVGYAGLLDLGYVAFFAIGAYATGVMTTPNMITCPPPGDSVVVVQQARADEGAFDGNFRALTRETVGVVSGSPTTHTANMIRRAQLIEFNTLDAAISALVAGDVAAVVNHRAEVQPYLEPNNLAASNTFRASRDAWDPASFDDAKWDAWCGGGIPVLPFWAAWPAAGLIAGLAGVMLGVPVLRMRGDYLAIVTLGFGEIIRIVALSDTFADYLGGAQGVTDIPSPTLNLTALSEPLRKVPFLSDLGKTLSDPIVLSSANEIYYLVIISVLVIGFFVYRLSQSRLGRSWMAMREDEDVAEAMGINLVNTKLLAFASGATFAGIGGAIFGAWLHSIFPNSFTLMVSINVLSLIIIGGLGSIPGVVVGAFALIGLPEVLREFADYRMLAFGALLVVMMLVRPEGLLPGTISRLEQTEDEENTEAELTEGGKA